ncbi:MAG: aminopeptidase P family N-terminal domain-containing protein, partial [Microlunatus sp.]|nr:aminopeptidase P family N-terminal domain-containing protein [Microlunatus sp.]
MSPADRLGTGTPVADFLVTDHHDTDPAGLSRRAGGPPVAELAARLLRVRERMAEQSLAALVVTDPANIYYLVGYDAWSFYTPQCLVVPARGAPALFTRAMDAAGASYTAALPSAQIHGYPEALVHRPDRHPFDWITARAVELGVLPDTGHAIVAV